MYKVTLLAVQMLLAAGTVKAAALYSVVVNDLGEAGRSCGFLPKSDSIPVLSICTGIPGELGKARSDTGSVGVYAALTGDHTVHSANLNSQADFFDFWSYSGPDRTITALLTLTFDGTNHGFAARADLELTSRHGGTPGACFVADVTGSCTATVIFSSAFGFDLHLTASANARQGTPPLPDQDSVVDFFNSAKITGVVQTDAGGAVPFSSNITDSGGVITGDGYAAAPAAAVPEPSSVIMLVLACAALALKTRLFTAR